MNAHLALDFDRTNNLSTGGEYGDPAIMHVPALVPIEPVDVPVSPVATHDEDDETGAIGVKRQRVKAILTSVDQCANLSEWYMNFNPDEPKGDETHWSCFLAIVRTGVGVCHMCNITVIEPKSSINCMFGETWS